MKYHQITSGERYVIQALRREGLSQSAVARGVGRSPATISRELRRNLSSQGRYTPSKANERAHGRRSRSRRNAHFGPDDWVLVEHLIGLDWSPEQVSGWLRLHRVLAISYETIYLRIWNDKASGGQLWLHLRQAGKKRRKRYGAYDSRGRLAGKRHISERPAEVEGRQVLGHWEIDTMKGNDQARHSVLTMVERAVGYVAIGKLECHTAAETSRRCIELIGRQQGRMHSITADNGTEFHDYRKIEAATACPSTLPPRITPGSGAPTRTRTG